MNNRKTNINYLDDSSKMKKEIEQRMKKGEHEKKPYEKTDHTIHKASGGSVMRHMTSENFLNRTKAPQRDILKRGDDEKMWKTTKRYKKVEILPIGRIKKNLGDSYIAGNLVRGEDIVIRPQQAGDEINITIPQDERNKTIHNVNKADIIITPYNTDTYTRTGNLLQRNQSTLLSANRILLTPQFTRHYMARKMKGDTTLQAYQDTINEQINYHTRKDHEMFNPYIKDGPINISNQHVKREIFITEKIKTNGEYGDNIYNIKRVDVAKLHQIAKLLSPQEGIKTKEHSLSEISGVV